MAHAQVRLIAAWLAITRPCATTRSAVQTVGVPVECNTSDGSSAELQVELRVEPQFVHRTLAAQAFGVDEQGTLSDIANAVVAAIPFGNVRDIRLAAITSELQNLESQVVCLRAGVYFRYEGEGSNERCHFHQSVGVDESRVLKIAGTFDPSRFEANSPKSNLSGQRNVHITGIATNVDPDADAVEIRPILIGIPYFISTALADAAPVWARQKLELHYSRVDQFRINGDSASASITAAETNRLFAMPEYKVKEAFAQILNVTNVPNDWAGELSDLVGHLTVEGTSMRAAFAFKGPGGKLRPWTLHPAGMGKNGDQAVRLFSEHADVMVVQHCGPIAASVGHVMEALATKHGKRYMIMDGDATTRVLIQAGLLE